MKKQAGDPVVHPEDGRKGVILEVHTNPACLMRSFVILWEDGEQDELEEIEFGPLED